MVGSKNKIADTTVLRPSDQQISCKINQNQVILLLSNGVYYGLNSVGQVIWDLIQTGISIGEVKARLLESYDVSEERCEKELHQLISEMLEIGLLVIES